MPDKQPYDYNHMKRTLDSLMVAWKAQPYLRLGQLLMNAAIGVIPTQDGPPDLFSVEDDELSRMVIKYSDDQLGSKI